MPGCGAVRLVLANPALNATGLPVLISAPAGASNVRVRDPDGDNPLVSDDPSDSGSQFHPLICCSCSAVLGKYYVAPTHAALQSLFVFKESALGFYKLGTCTTGYVLSCNAPVADSSLAAPAAGPPPSAAASGSEPASAAAAPTPAPAALDTLSERLTDTQSLALGCLERVQSCEAGASEVRAELAELRARMARLEAALDASERGSRGAFADSEPDEGSGRKRHR